MPEAPFPYVLTIPGGEQFQVRMDPWALPLTDQPPNVFAEYAPLLISNSTHQFFRGPSSFYLDTSTATEHYIGTLYRVEADT